MSAVKSKHTRSFSSTLLDFSLPNNIIDKDIYSDRFIPSRLASNFDNTLLSPLPILTSPKLKNIDNETLQNDTYNLLIRNEILRESSTSHFCNSPSILSNNISNNNLKNSNNNTPISSPSRVFRFKSTPKTPTTDNIINSPVSVESQLLLLSPTSKPSRMIAKHPYKVLDAPSLADDFYLNLVDWSPQNVLAVGLSSCCYLWSAATAKVIKLCDLEDENDGVTSVSWTQKGSHLAVGTRNGHCLIYDVAKCKLLRRMSGHNGRVGAMAWNASTLASGSRDNSILLHDVRKRDHVYSTLVGHKQEVCGLKWSFDDSQLASGGNDNKLLIWSASMTGQSETQPLFRFSDHEAAVKAIVFKIISIIN